MVKVEKILKDDKYLKSRKLIKAKRYFTVYKSEIHNKKKHEE